MTGTKQARIRFHLLATLGLCAAAAFAQSDPVAPAPRSIQIQSPPSGSLAGRLTDLHSAPLAGVALVLRNQATGAELHLTTQRNGGFCAASLGAGVYSIEADEPQLGHGQLEGIVVSGGAESRVQAAIRFEPVPPARAVSLASTVPAPAASSASAASLVQDRMAQAASPGEPAAAPENTAASAAAAVRFAPPAAALPQTMSALVAPLLATAAERPWPVAPRALPAASAQPNAAPELAEAISSLPLASATISSAASSSTPVSKLPATPQLRAALETESAPIESALVVSVPHALALPEQIGPELLLSDAVEAIQAAMVRGAGRFAPIEATTEKPDPVSPAVESTLTAAQLQSLPVSGRRWQEFLLDEPAAAASPDATQPSFRGTSAQSTETTVEGASTRLAFGETDEAASSGSDNASSEDAGQAGSTSQSWRAGRGLGVSEAAIREVTATAGNAEAESMHAAGGRTGIRTESGGNVLHGRAFVFDRQNTWGARNPFTQWAQNTGSAAAPNFASEPYTPSDHELVWGFGAGGGIRRDKLFWFAALDSNHRNDPGVASARHAAEFFSLPEPTSADVTLLSARLGESQNQAYNDFLGVPSGDASAGPASAGLEQLAALLGPAPRTAAQWLGFGRIDWQATERQHFAFEGTAGERSAPGGGVTRAAETYGSHSFGSSQTGDERLLARWEAYLSPNLLAVTQASAGRVILTARPEAPSAFEKAFLNGNFWGQLPQIVVDSRYGFTIGNPSRFGQGSYPDEKLLHAQQGVDWVHGKMLVRAGFELDHNADSTSRLRNQTGTYVYSKVQDFISDALAFLRFGFADALDARNPHNCGPTDKTFGSQPCYSHYSQTLGPSQWQLSTNDWAGYATAQWQASKFAVFSAGLRWELEQMPPPIAALANPQLPLAGAMPSLGSNWGPRVSLALGQRRSGWPVLRLGYGMYFGRVQDATILTALTHTGSLKGDLNFFMRPSDDCQHCSGGAPPFPYVFEGQPSSAVKPGVVEFAPNFRNPEVHQAVAAIEQQLPGHIELTAEAMLSLGRRLPVSIDTNIDTSVNPQPIIYGVKDATGKGPIKDSRITVPLYATLPYTECAGSPHADPVTGQCGRLNPNYQQITQIMSRANSTYEGAVVSIARESTRGLSFRAHYTYAHAMDWNPNESSAVAGSSVLDPTNLDAEYGVSNLDVRHSAAIFAILDAPWKLRGSAGRIANGWMLSGIGQFRSGLPYSMRVSGSIPQGARAGSGNLNAGFGAGLNGFGGDNRLNWIGSGGEVFGVGRNTFRYPNTWKADLRLAKRFDLGERRELEVLAETFNLFNHQNVTRLETTGYTIENSSSGDGAPTLCFLAVNVNGLATCGSAPAPGSPPPLPAFGQPLSINATDFYRERQIQFGLRMSF